MHHSSFAGYKFRADSEQASFYASSNRMMSRGRLKNHPDIIMWGEACIINKSFLYKARWHRRSVSNPSPILLQSFSDPSPILLRSFSDPSPILLQPFSNPSPIPPNPPQVLLHPCNLDTKTAEHRGTRCREFSIPIDKCLQDLPFG